jgi:protein-disulfide isomerase/uncharacterized membrane protein
MKTDKQILHLPFPFYFWPVTVIALAGFFNSVYLAISHYRIYTDIAYKSFCAISKSLNCDTVSQSPYAILLGIPVAVWGIIGYMFFLSFLPFAWSNEAEKKKIWAILFIVALGFSLYSIILALISTFYIHSYCIMCIISYAINFLLLYYTWLIRRRFDSSGILNGLKLDFGFLWLKKNKTLPLFLTVLGFLLLVFTFFPTYWNLTPPLLSEDIPQGVTEEGYPWIGAKNPELEITEFTDYQCFQCKKMHFYLRQLVVNYPAKIRLVHRHFPMDHEYNPLVKQPYHLGSGAMAIFAKYAQSQGRFWEMNDALYSIADRERKKRINIKELAKAVGLEYKALASSIQHKTMRYQVKHDISIGIQLGINGTPGYVINDKVYVGRVPPDVIRNILD